MFAKLSPRDKFWANWNQSLQLFPCLFTLSCWVVKMLLLRVARWTNVLGGGIAMHSGLMRERKITVHSTLPPKGLLVPDPLLANLSISLKEAQIDGNMLPVHSVCQVMCWPWQMGALGHSLNLVSSPWRRNGNLLSATGLSFYRFGEDEVYFAYSFREKSGKELKYSRNLEAETVTKAMEEWYLLVCSSWLA